MKLLRRIFILAIIVLFSCDRDNTVSTDDDPWISGLLYIISTDTLSHANRIYESSHFLTFSDASSDDVKRNYSQMAENSFQELLQLFEIPDAASLGITDRSSKMTIYCDRYLNHRPMAFPYGFIFPAVDSPIFINWPEWQRERYRNIIKHETMHVIQFLLGLIYHRLSPPEMPEVWFTEGLAEYVSGGANIPITSLEQVNAWRDLDNHTNPISIHQWADFPIPDERAGEYYPMFGLALWYLLDENGHGKTIMDVKAMFEDLSSGSYFFTEAFELHMGMTVSEFEVNFYNLIEAFFSRLETV